MDLDKLEIALRPRSHWEAMDLGFALARRWFKPLCALWLMSMLPVLLVGYFLTDGDMMWLSLLVWWLKPLYEPPLMFWLSRAVFDERLPLKAVRNKWWGIVRPQLFANITWRRLSPNRSFYMPVALLEGLKGKERQQRIAVLGRRQQTGTWLTVVGFHFEIILEFCFLLTLYFIIPEELRWFHGSNFILSPGPIDEWLQLICWMAAMAIIAPFYVSGGFALYLHRRSELEGWDIEINFRRTVEKTAARRRGGAAALAASLLLLFTASSVPGEVMAGDNPGPEESREIIGQVLTDPLFGRMESQNYWKYIGDQREETETETPQGLVDFLKLLFEIIKGFLKGTAEFGEIILWGGGLLIVAFLLYHFSLNSEWMQSLGQGRSGGKRKLPTELFGLDVRADSVPDDIADEALKMLGTGDLRGALSLLYRGALIRLISEHQLDIPASATEGECLRLVQRHRDHGEADYFGKLTRMWLTTAYAHCTPESARIEQLCHDWQQVYGHAER